MNRNLLVVMSGGTTSVINATLCGIIREAQENKNIDRIYAGNPGFIGFNKDKLLDLTDISKDKLDKLYYIPTSCFIGTTRVEKTYVEEIETLCEQFEKYDIEYFVNIGGNGTIEQSKKIAEISPIVKVAAAPKTVDNDLGDSEFKFVHYTPGFPSCVNYWKHKAAIMNLENLGACSHDSVLITQTFGRETGFLAGSARLTDRKRKLPLIILLPEDQKSPDEVMKKIEQTLVEQNRAIVVMSEGYTIDEIGEVRDKSGQIMYSSSATTNAQNLVNHCLRCGVQARSFIPSIDQRSDGIFCTKSDLKYSYELGKYTIDKLSKGNRNFLSSIDENLEIIAIPFPLIENYSRVMKPSWINYGNYDVTEEYLNYVENLIKDPLYDFTKFESNIEI